MMKATFIFLLVIPFLAFSQSKAKSSKHTGNEFIITGDVTGFADGTSVSFLNEQTNQPEKQTTIEKGKFVIKGHMDEPGFKGLIFGDQAPIVPLFIENSDITITGNKNALDQLVVKGSPTHALYVEYSNALKPYDKIIASGVDPDENAKKEIEKISEEFVQKHSKSYVAPLAVIRMYQLTLNGKKAETLYNLMPADVQMSGLGQFANQQIQESKINPIGSTIKDFSQNDTTGKPINISSFRG
ncbi:MAG: DUF4369 domain-containing protein, partial [Bacteroidota bacterium]|nr:DUF4369 domain-containing protein [Bacteroidota bacterium]